MMIQPIISQETATNEFHATTPSTKRCLFSRNLIGIGVFHDHHLRLWLHDHWLVVVWLLPGLNHYFLVVGVGLLVARLHLIVHFYFNYYKSCSLRKYKPCNIFLSLFFEDKMKTR